MLSCASFNIICCQGYGVDSEQLEVRLGKRSGRRYTSVTRQHEVIPNLVSLESHEGPLEVRTLFLQALVVGVDGQKLWKAGGIHLNLFSLN